MEINRDYAVDVKNVMLVKHKKKQIILAHTSSTLEEFFNKLKTRCNGKYDKIPTYVISLEGVVYELFDPNFNVNFMEDESIDKISISIVLENQGWLTKDPFEPNYYDWKSNAYNEGVIEKSWRNKKYWASYGDEQMINLVELIGVLGSEFNISKDFVGDNTSIHKPKTFKGIINRSNYTKNYYDLSPAFDFNKFNELIQKQQKNDTNNNSNENS